MKNRGFTLVELMAVITILAILSLIIVPIIDKNVKKGKDDVYKIQIENIKFAAMNYYTDNISLRPRNGESNSISLSALVENNYISDVDVKTFPKKYQNEEIQVFIFNDSGKYLYLVCPLEEDCE